MPTASERAAAEAERWHRLAERWSPERVPALYAELPPSEEAVVSFFDPEHDLHRRTADWGFALERPHLDQLARFAADLANAEAQAWSDDVPDLAMRAYESRRLLVGDRIAHWAVPWLDAVVRWHPEVSEAAMSHRDTLLELGDEMRVAPALTGSEGLTVPGEDSFGPIAIDVPLHRHLQSLWSGLVMLGRVINPESLAEPGSRDVLRAEYLEAAQRWRAVAEAHPGSAALWLDLGSRAERTASALRRVVR